MAWFLEKCTTDCKSFTAGVKCLLSLKSHQNVTRGKRLGFGSRGNIFLVLNEPDTTSESKNLLWNRPIRPIAVCIWKCVEL